jgi:hypothetical protein
MDALHHFSTGDIFTIKLHQTLLFFFFFYPCIDPAFFCFVIVIGRINKTKDTLICRGVERKNKRSDLMTRTYLKPKILTLGDELLTETEKVLDGNRGRAELNPYLVMSTSGASYHPCNAAVLGVVKKLRERGCLVTHERGTGYIVTYPYKCLICGDYWKTLELKTVCEMGHTKPAVPTAPLPTCTKCTRTFGTKKALIAHLEKGCNGLEPAELAPGLKKVKILLKSHKDAKTYTILDAPSNIKDRGSMRPSDVAMSEPTEEDLRAAADEAKGIRANKGTFLEFAKKYAELWNMSDTKVMEIIMSKLEAP